MKSFIDIVNILYPNLSSKEKYRQCDYIRRTAYTSLLKKHIISRANKEYFSKFDSASSRSNKICKDKSVILSSSDRYISECNRGRYVFNSCDYNKLFFYLKNHYCRDFLPNVNKSGRSCLQNFLLRISHGKFIRNTKCFRKIIVLDNDIVVAKYCGVLLRCNKNLSLFLCFDCAVFDNKFDESSFFKVLHLYYDVFLLMKPFNVVEDDDCIKIKSFKGNCIKIKSPKPENCSGPFSIKFFDENLVDFDSHIKFYSKSTDYCKTVKIDDKDYYVSTMKLIPSNVWEIDVSSFNLKLLLK